LDDLLSSGRYAEVPRPNENDDAHAHAAWAFAQFYLRPSTSVAQNAKRAHEQGDDLGTFVLMQCHRSGVGLVRDRAEAVRLNFELRMKLEQKENPTPLEMYMLSQCEPGDARGEIRDTAAEKVFAEVNRRQRLGGERLRKAAELGVAQACQDLALAYQRAPDA